MKMDCDYTILNRLCTKLLGDNHYGLQVKPDLFAMSFVYNPKNYLYLKSSLKTRKNKVGVDHSSAKLL